MKNKKIAFLILVMSTLFLLDTIGETEPHSLFGISINIWLIRCFWGFMLVVSLIGLKQSK